MNTISIRSANCVQNVNLTNTVLKSALRDPGFLNVCHFNSQSIHTRKSNKIDEVRNIFDNTNLQIIGVSKTWLEPYITNKLVEIHGFTLFRNDRLGQRGGEVAIFVKNSIEAFVIAKSVEKASLTSEELSKLDKTQFPTTGIQFFFLEVHIQNIKLLFGVVYNPKSTRFDNRNNLSPMFTDLLSQYNDILIFGDFNTDLLVDKPHISNFKEMLSEFGLYNYSNVPTHFTGTSSTLLDLLLISHYNKVIQLNQIDIPGISKQIPGMSI